MFSSSDSFPVYKDGLGNIIPNDDAIIREKAMKELTKLFSRRIEFEGSFRAGTVTYIEGELRISFYHEMYGGKYHFGVEIPTEAQWEKQTNTPLNRRQEIIEFVAQTVKQKQAPSWNYEIRENDIAFY